MIASRKVNKASVTPVTFGKILAEQIAGNMDFQTFIIKQGFAQGRSVMAKEARSLSMADRIAMLEEVLQGS
jgi:hypothetical protein